jgi:beta-lactam-binding protein with PASTA domain
MKILQYIKSKEFWLTIAKMLLITIVLVFLLKFWLGFSTNHNQKIKVPDLSTMTRLKMKQALDPLNLNYVVQDTASFNPKFPPLTVIDQNPEPGDFVKENRKIYVTLNPAGYRKLKIPSFLGKTKNEIVLQLKTLGYKIGAFSYVPDRGRNVVRGLRFNGNKLKKGDLVPKNSTINLVLGDGNGSVIIVKDTLGKDGK